MSHNMINLHLPVLISSIFFLVFISSSFLFFATPSFAARVGHSLMQEEVTKIPQHKLLEEPEVPEEPEEPELPLPEEPEIPEEPEVPEAPEEPEVPEEPEEPEEPKFEFPSWIPSFPFPGVNGGFQNNEKTKPTATVEEVPAKCTTLSEETSSGSSKKP